jgi:hypothetical protein
VISLAQRHERSARHARLLAAQDLADFGNHMLQRRTVQGARS